jgi:hypothetical protein
MARTPFPIRERNWLGGPVDIKNPKWLHQNLQVYGEAIPLIAAAFATDDPFAALGYSEDPFTRSIEKWSARPCKVDESYLISFESHEAPAIAFVDFLAAKFGLEVMCEYTGTSEHKSGVHYANWKRRIEYFDSLGNRIPYPKPTREVSLKEQD